MTRHSQKTSFERQSSLAPADVSSEVVSGSTAGTTSDDADAPDNAEYDVTNDATGNAEDGEDGEIDEEEEPKEGDAVVGEDLSALLQFDRTNRRVDLFEWLMIPMRRNVYQ